MTNFNFSKETPPDALYKEVQSLNKLDSQQFEEVCSLTLQLCIDPAKGSKVLEELEELIARHGLPQSGVKAAFKALITVANGGMRSTVNSEQLQEDLISLGLSEDKAQSMTAQWSANQSSLSRSALSQTLMVNQLVDMEWKFGVTAASSDLNKVGNTFLQLKLLINKGNKMETVHMELSLNQFYSFLHEMERAKASLDYFS